MIRTSAPLVVLVVAFAWAPGCGPAAGVDASNGEATSGWVTPVTESPAEASTEVHGSKDSDRWPRVAAGLDPWTPLLVDASGDAKDGDATHDIRQVTLAMTKDDVLVRFRFGADVTTAEGKDLRFWLEQGKRFLTIETKAASSNQECTITEVGHEVQIFVDSCFHLSEDTVDIAIPRKEFPSSLDLKDDFWLSGPQVCCRDEARSEAIDELAASQVVWRVPEG